MCYVVMYGISGASSTGSRDSMLDPVTENREDTDSDAVSTNQFLYKFLNSMLLCL